MSKQENHELIIVCKDVHKWYGSFQALRGVTHDDQLMIFLFAHACIP